MARLGSRFGLAIVVAIAAVGFSVPVANASLLGLNNNCGATSQPFAQFGDYRNYTFGTNGGLELGATGWSLAGASVVAGNSSRLVVMRDGRVLSDRTQTPKVAELGGAPAEVEASLATPPVGAP